MNEYTPITEEVRDSYDYQFTLGMNDISRIAEFDRWLAEHDREVKADAWDEGFAEGLGDGCSCDGCLKWVSNPYREKTE